MQHSCLVYFLPRCSSTLYRHQPQLDSHPAGSDCQNPKQPSFLSLPSLVNHLPVGHSQLPLRSLSSATCGSPLHHPSAQRTLAAEHCFGTCSMAATRSVWLSSPTLRTPSLPPCRISSPIYAFPSSSFLEFPYNPSSPSPCVRTFPSAIRWSYNFTSVAGRLDSRVQQVDIRPLIMTRKYRSCSYVAQFLRVCVPWIRSSVRRRSGDIPPSGVLASTTPSGIFRSRFECTRTTASPTLALSS